MKKIKLWMFLPVSLVLVIGTLGCFGAIVPYEEKETRTEPISGFTTFSLTNTSGMVKVSTGASTEIKVEATKIVMGNTRAEAKTHIDDIKIKYLTSANTFKVETVQPDGSFFENYSVDYTITLPASLNLTLKNTNGDIEVANTQNTVDVDTTNSDVKVTNVSGDVKVKTTNGKVNLNGIQGSVDAESSNGDLDADVTMPLNGHITMTTTNGSITLKIPETTSAQVDAKTTNGDVSSEIAITSEVSQERNQLKGNIGDGTGGKITLKSTNGDVAIKKK